MVEEWKMSKSIDNSLKTEQRKLKTEDLRQIKEQEKRLADRKLHEMITKENSRLEKVRKTKLGEDRIQKAVMRFNMDTIKETHDLKNALSDFFLETANK